jgi:hypothetical protein
VTPFFSDEHLTVYHGDALTVLRELPSESVHCVVTSPPYWGLRDYGIHGQIGLESSLAAYLHKLTGIFAQARRLLRPDGILWLNIGDGYTSGNRGWRAPDKKNPNRAMSVRPDNPPGLKDKDLLGVPWRLAFALQADGWYLRSDVIWHKPNAMPERQDRPTRSHEYLFMLTKEAKYSYHAEEILEAGRRHPQPAHRLEHQHRAQRQSHRLVPRRARPTLHPRFDASPGILSSTRSSAAGRSGWFVSDSTGGSSASSSTLLAVTLPWSGWTSRHRWPPPKASVRYEVATPVSAAFLETPGDRRQSP